MMLMIMQMKFLMTFLTPRGVTAPPPNKNLIPRFKVYTIGCKNWGIVCVGSLLFPT